MNIFLDPNSSSLELVSLVHDILVRNVGPKYQPFLSVPSAPVDAKLKRLASPCHKACGDNSMHTLTPLPPFCSPVSISINSHSVSCYSWHAFPALALTLPFALDPCHASRRLQHRHQLHLQTCLLPSFPEQIFSFSSPRADGLTLPLRDCCFCYHYCGHWLQWKGLRHSVR